MGPGLASSLSANGGKMPGVGSFTGLPQGMEGDLVQMEPISPQDSAATPEQGAKLTQRAPGDGMRAEVFLTPEQVAERTQLCVSTVRRLCIRREIPGATKPAGRWRIPEAGYQAWLASSEPEPGVMRPRPQRKMAPPASRWQLRAIEGGDAHEHRAHP
jgi:excisionase family DNA binding protein